MIPRDAHVATVVHLLDQFPVVALLGARQVGKTTLARMVAERVGAAIRFDLEDPRDDTRLTAPMLALEPLRGLVVLDEIQRRPDLFPPLRVLADRPGTPARFLILGSASPELIRTSAESLAGRVAHHERSVITWTCWSRPSWSGSCRPGTPISPSVRSVPPRSILPTRDCCMR